MKRLERCLRWVLPLLLLGTPVCAVAQQVKLRVTLQVATSEPYLGVPLVRFKEEVERRSNNAIAIEIIDKGQLYIDTEVVDAVSSGAIEMGAAGTYQFSKTIPDISLVEEPFLFNFDALLRAAVAPESEIRKLIDATILRATGVRVLWWQSAGTSIFFSKGAHLADPATIKGKRVRVFSTITALLAEECGGTPTVISTSKMNEAIRDGKVDVAMGSVVSVEPRELWKVADTITLTNHLPIEFLLLINERVWLSLSPGHQRIIAEAAREVERQTRDRVSALEAAAFAFARQKGMRIYSLSAHQVAEWRACSADVLFEFASHAGDIGRQLLAAYGRLRTQPCCSVGPTEAPFTGQ
jgi:C4-dicarboxylate-binding protein DctP